MKPPVILYVDDEPHNLVVFEAALPEEWKVVTYDNPVTALQHLEKIRPDIIVTDQRMPGMMGVQFLELARKFNEHAVRIIVTGFSDEDLVVESVRKAHIFDYIRKPWEVDDLIASLKRAHEFFRANEEARRLHVELNAKVGELETSRRQESDLRKEFECWLPPFLVRALQEQNVKFPLEKDLVGVTFDIVKSSKLRDIMVKGQPVRSQVIQLFSQAVIRHGGWRESQSGDSAYAHFGLLPEAELPADAALAVAREFRLALRNFAQLNGVSVECGVALHALKSCRVDIESVQLQTPGGLVTQKSFSTASGGIDLLHRMEKLVHALPGSNIIMSAEFIASLQSAPGNVLKLGPHKLDGQSQPVELFMIASDMVKPEDLAKFGDKAA